MIKLFTKPTDFWWVPPPTPHSLISSPYFHQSANHWLRGQCGYCSHVNTINTVSFWKWHLLLSAFTLWSEITYHIHLCLPQGGSTSVTSWCTCSQANSWRTALQELGSIRGTKRSNPGASSKSKRGISKTKPRYLHHLTTGKTAEHTGKIATTCCTPQKSPKYPILRFT